MSKVKHHESLYVLRSLQSGDSKFKDLVFFTTLNQDHTNYSEFTTLPGTFVPVSTTYFKTLFPVLTSWEVEYIYLSLRTTVKIWGLLWSRTSFHVSVNWF